MRNISGRDARLFAFGLCVGLFLASCGGGTTASVGNGGAGGGSGGGGPSPPPQTNSSLANLTVNQAFAAVSTVLSADLTAGGSSANVSTSLAGLDGQSKVTYTVSDAGFTVSIKQDIVSFNEVFTSSNIDQSASNDSVRVYRVTHSDNTVDEFDLLIPAEPNMALSYVTYGQWNSPNGSNRSLNFGTVVFGVQTPAANMPTTGSATYDGSTFGTLNIGSTLYNVGGFVELTADFSTSNVTGSTALMSKQNLQTGGVSAWRDLTFNATITSGTNQFLGSAASDDSAVTGTVAGGFYGPSTNGIPPEIGGAWRVSGSGETAIGGFVARQ